MNKPQTSRELEIVTAVMLGLVSIVTALGAWQSAVWNSIADEYARDAGDARDVSVSQAVLADYALRLDAEASGNALRYYTIAQSSSDPIEAGLGALHVQSEAARTSPGFAEAWQAWADAGFPSDTNPLEDQRYLAELRKIPDSYSYASQQLSAAADAQHAKSGILSQAALVQALALFLFGIAGVNRLYEVRAAVLALGVAIFLGGLALAATAF